MKLRICHLVDDLNPGGVTRMLDFIMSSAAMAKFADHEVICTGLGTKAVPATDADVIVSHLSIKWANLPFYAKLRTRYRRVPLVHVEHSYSQAFFDTHVSAKTRFRTLLRLSYSLFDRVVAVSTRQGAWLTEFAVAKPGKLIAIPPCVDLSDFLGLAPAIGRPVGRIGAIGRLHDQKGFDILIEAFRALDLGDVTLEVFGNGPEEEALHALAGDCKAIRFHGHTDDPVAAMQSVEAIVMPSRREPYGLVALESLAAGRSLLVSGVDGLSDHVANGATEVAPNTAQAWSEALKNLTSTDNDAAVLASRSKAEEAEGLFANRWQKLLSELRD